MAVLRIEGLSDEYVDENLVQILHYLGWIDGIRIPRKIKKKWKKSDLKINYDQYIRRIFANMKTKVTAQAAFNFNTK